MLPRKCYTSQKYLLLKPFKMKVYNQDCKINTDKQITQTKHYYCNWLGLQWYTEATCGLFCHSDIYRHQSEYGCSCEFVLQFTFQCWQYSSYRWYPWPILIYFLQSEASWVSMLCSFYILGIYKYLCLYIFLVVYTYIIHVNMDLIM